MLRLLCAATLTFHEFELDGGLDSAPPPYAILSHTWGRDADEVSYRDVRQASAAARAAWRQKIVPFARRAAADGYRYVWVDTCCIDKTSSAELQQAINSMYRWYHAAARCYAVLLDVTTTTEDAAAGSFARSRWFTRGWTLQELLAPPDVVFYNAAWERLGTRATLAARIADVTGIDAAFLQSRGLSLRAPSVAERMHWAARRVTKQPEDQSYALLGLFGVSMPVLYGEGADAAFRRLQDAIIATVPDDSILAWGASPLCGSIDAGVDGDRATGAVPGPLLAQSPADFLFSRGIKTGARLRAASSSPGAAETCIVDDSSAVAELHAHVLETAPGAGRLVLNCYKTSSEGDASDAARVTMPVAWRGRGGFGDYFRPRDASIGCIDAADRLSTMPKATIYLNSYKTPAQPLPAPGTFRVECAARGMRIAEACPASAWDRTRSAFVFAAGPAVMGVRLAPVKTADKGYVLLIVSPTRTFASSRWLVLADTGRHALESVLASWTGFRSACRADARPVGQSVSRDLCIATRHSAAREYVFSVQSVCARSSVSSVYSVDEEMARLAAQRASTTTTATARLPAVAHAHPPTRSDMVRRETDSKRPASTPTPAATRSERRLHFWRR